MSDLITFDVAYVFETIAAKVGLNLICDGIDDQCYGVVITSPQAFAQFLQKHKAPYNFQVIDGDPIRIKRRVVNSDLVIDFQVTQLTNGQKDCVLRDPSQAAIKFTRVDPLSLSREIEVQYVDPDRLYAANTQVARHQGAKIFANRTSTKAKAYHGRTATQIDFVINKDQAMAIANGMLYRQWEEQLSATLELDRAGLIVEPGDVFLLTCDQGVYTMLVQTSMLTKERTNQLTATALLTQAGIIAPGGQADPFFANAQSGILSATGAALVDFQSPTFIGAMRSAGSGGFAATGQSSRGSVLAAAGVGTFSATEIEFSSATVSAAGAGALAAVAPPIPFAIGNDARNTTWAGTSSDTVTISVSAGSVVLVCVHQAHPSVTETVASATSAHLTFAQRGAISHINSNVDGHHQEYEYWWAHATSALTSEVITVTSSGTPTAATIEAFECQNVTNPSSPWDGNGSLPVSNANGSVNTAASVSGVSTNSGAPVIFFLNSATQGLSATFTGFTTIGGSGLANIGSVFSLQRNWFEQFNSTQSGASYSVTGNSADWMVIVDAFA
ncbi:MAG: hypothetical protein JWP25_8961 [Bradyrhizobium sp.]|nr:hypothetical protein [Bradyrhizobium sp.]